MATLSRKMQKPKSSDLAFISNSLIESFIKKGNIVGFKILFYLSRCNIEIGADLMLIKLSTKELCDYCKIDIKTLQRNIKQITEMSITVTDEKSMSYITILPYAKFGYGGTLEIKMFREILELIKKTKNQFTVIDTTNVMKLNSKHSVRMIMLLEYIANFDEHIAKRKYYEFEELNLMFGTNYKRMMEFERKILKPIKEELDNNSKLSFVYDIKYDKDENTVGRAKAVGVTINVIDGKNYKPKSTTKTDKLFDDDTEDSKYAKYYGKTVLAFGQLRECITVVTPMSDGSLIVKFKDNYELRFITEKVLEMHILF